MSQQDEITMAERLGQLDEENKKLKDDLSTAKAEIRSLNNYYRAGTLFKQGARALLILFCVLCAVSPLYLLITTPKVITHCLITSRTVATDKKADGWMVYTDTWDLTGEIPWGDDARLGYFKTIEEAKAAAALVNCPDVNK